MAGAQDSNLGGNARANHPGAIRTPRPMSSGKGVAVRQGSSVAKKGSGTVAKRAAEEGAKGASKAWKFGRAIRVGGGPATLAAAATYELAKSAVDHRNDMLKKGYVQSVEKNADNQWSPTGVHSVYRKPAVQNAAKRRASGYQHASTPGATKAERLKNARSDYKRRLSHKANANPADNSKDNEDAYFNYRQARMQKKDYKGKYYGPDEFKGNIQKLSKWRAAGSPKDKSKFA